MFQPHSTLSGTGNPMVLLHGFGLSSSTWRFITPELERHFRCHALDLPGFGESRPPENFQYTLQGYAESIIGYMDSLDLKRVALVGHSLGGTIAIMSLIISSEQYANRISSICIVDSPCYTFKLPDFIRLPSIPVFGRAILDFVPPKWQMLHVLRRCFYDPSSIREEQVEIYSAFLQRDYVRRAISKLSSHLIGMESDRYVSSIRKLEKPLLILWGDNDSVIPLSYGSRLHQDVIGSEFVSIGNCGHMPHEERPQETSEALLGHSMQHGV